MPTTTETGPVQAGHPTVPRAGQDTGTLTRDGPSPGGWTTPNTDIANANPYRYADTYFDTTTGLYAMGARYYDPSLARFTQLDSAGHLLDLRQGDRYSYAGDDPVNSADPSGAMGFSCAELDSCAPAGSGGGFCLFGHNNSDPTSGCVGGGVAKTAGCVFRGLEQPGVSATQSGGEIAVGGILLEGAGALVAVGGPVAAPAAALVGAFWPRISGLWYLSGVFKLKNLRLERRANESRPDDS